MTLRSTHRLAGGLLALAAIAVLSPSADADESRRPFPLRVQNRGEQSVRLAPDADALRALVGRDRRVILDAVPLPGGEDVSLVLDPVRITDEDTLFAVDGFSRPFDDVAAGVSMWRGRVIGDEDSFVFLSFSPFGSRGLIRRTGQLVQLVAEPDPVTGWAEAASRFTDVDPEVSPSVQATCGASSMEQPVQRAAEEVRAAAERRRQARREAAEDGETGVPALGGLIETTYECRIAIETDYQFYQNFNDEDAARTYIVSLMGAVSALYESEVGCVITLPYVGIYTNSSDGWSSQDSGGSAQSLLYEFRAAWMNGNAPVDADLHHFISGADLGGGIAYIDVLCSSNYGFGVSGNIEGDLTFPVTEGYGTWDFVVVAHELGHNFVSPHTHDFCPPIDRCAPSGYFGPCQSSQVCISSGTIMSYCHACPGGMSNIDLQFHGTVSSLVRDAVEASCLGEYVPDGDALCLASADTVLETCSFGGSAPAPVTVIIQDCLESGNLPFTATITDSPAWLSVSPPTGTITASTFGLTLTFDPSSLGSGTSEAVLVVTNTDDPAEVVSVPVTLEVSPIAFRPGDRLDGTIGDVGDVDRGDFDGVKGADFCFSVTLGDSDPALKITLFDGDGDKIDSWTAKAGKTTDKKESLPADGGYELKLQASDGSSSGAYSLTTELDFPSSASAKSKTLKAKSGETYGQIKIRALAGATLDVTCSENSKFTGPLELTLTDPNGDEVDLAAALAGDGRSFTGQTLALTGQYKLRVHGYGGGKKEKVSVTVTPTQPVGVDTVVID